MKLQTLIVGGGILHLLLCLVSLPIPLVLGWRAQVKKMEPLTGLVFWTYAGYIWTIHLFFSLLSLFCADELVIASKLSMGICGFITVYWGTRVILQLSCFRQAHPPRNLFEKFGELALLALFLGMIAIYGYTTWSHLTR